VVPVAPGLGADDAINPETTTTPVQDAIDAVDAAASAVFDGTRPGKVILPARNIQEASTLNSLGGKAIVGVSPYASRVFIQDMTADGIQFDADNLVWLHNWTLHGTDKANGTAPAGVFANDTVVTIAEQREWLLDYIHARDFSATWTLTHLTGDILNGLEVFLERPEIAYLQQDSPKWTDASIRLRRGSSIG